MKLTESMRSAGAGAPARAGAGVVLAGAAAALAVAGVVGLGVVGLGAGGAAAGAAGAGAPGQTPAFIPPVVADDDIPGDIDRESWARLPTVRREALDAEGQRIFDRVVRPESRYASGLRGPIGMWMYSPRMAEHFFPASTYVRFGADGGRDQRIVELAILTAARALDSQYEWSAHEPLGVTAGLEQEIIDWLRHDGALDAAEGLPGFGAAERTVVRVVRELIRAPSLSREAFEAAQRELGNEGLVDLIGLIGHYTLVNYTLKAFDVQRPPGSQLLLPLP